MSDWTESENGACNNSDIYLKLVDEVDRLIRNSAFDLIRGKSRCVARLIVSQLAHIHKLSPKGEQ